jgi:tRNA (adenine37-N6)-methyltransferase
MLTIIMTPIGYVRGPVRSSKQDFWGNVESTIELDTERFTTDAVKGLEEFSHLEVFFHLSGIAEGSILTGASHPRDNPAWPEVGIFARRSRARPNRMGATICRLVRVNDLEVTVFGLDAFDGTPVLDLKPVLAEYLPDKKEIRQAQWTRELMATYFAKH